jgi:integrase
VDFFERIKTQAENTQKSNKTAINNWLRFVKEKPTNDNIYDLIQEWINYNHGKGLNPNSLKIYFDHVKAYLHHVGIKLDHYDIKENLNFPKKLEEEMYGLKLEEIQKILGVASYNKKCLYMAEIQSGLSTGEALKLRKKEIK